jgi:hypothetical protein
VGQHRWRQKRPSSSPSNNQVTIDVVDHLRIGWWAQEVQRRAAGEHLHVSGVRGKARDDDVQAALAADPGNDEQRHVELPFGAKTKKLARGRD